MSTNVLLDRCRDAAAWLAGGQTCDELNPQYESLARRLRASACNEVDRTCVIGVTSCMPGEGVTTIAANLAAHSVNAVRGPVLIVEANFERPSLAARLAVQANPGLAEALAKQESWQACVHPSRVPNVCVMPAGRVTHQSPNLGSIANAIPLLTSLRREYPFIVVDLPPASESELSLAFSEHLDGVLLVLEAERLRVQVVERTKSLYGQLGVNLLGVVLNKRRMHIPRWLYDRL